MPDAFANNATGLESPATHIFSVTPSDGSDLAHVSRALNVASSGEVRLTTVGGTTATVFVAAGTTFAVRATRVWQTGTNASGITALY